MTRAPLYTAGAAHVGHLVQAVASLAAAALELPDTATLAARAWAWRTHLAPPFEAPRPATVASTRATTTPPSRGV
jgi:hypothetical protein